jgi:hypothetical protein
MRLRDTRIQYADKAAWLDAVTVGNSVLRNSGENRLRNIM